MAKIGCDMRSTASRGTGTENRKLRRESEGYSVLLCEGSAVVTTRKLLPILLYPSMKVHYWVRRKNGENAPENGKTSINDRMNIYSEQKMSCFGVFTKM